MTLSLDGREMTLRTLPLPFKVLATCLLLTLGLAYLFAVGLLYIKDIEPHSQNGVSMVNSVIIKYYGKRDMTRLEAALGGAMGEYVSPAEKEQIIQWVRQGAKEAEFANIQPILESVCGACHDADSSMGLPPLTTYAGVAEFTSTDQGKSLSALLRVSHIHLFGMSFIFGLSGLIFAYSQTPLVFRSVLIAVPFMAIWLDIGSWWFTKYAPLFAYTVIIGGIFMGLALAGQIGSSLYEMWVLRPKREDA
jgi:hypothetical protein